MQAKFALANFKASVEAKASSPKEIQINDIADLTESELRSKFGLS